MSPLVPLACNGGCLAHGDSVKGDGAAGAEWHARVDEYATASPLLLFKSSLDGKGWEWVQAV